MPKSALVVDDEPHIRHLIRLVLQKLYFQDIIEASNGTEACQVYANQPTDVVLMDINMPQMTGIEALKEIQRCDPDSTIIMLTSMSSRKMVEECALAGATHYIRKDTPVQEMSKALNVIFHEIFV